MAGTNDITGSVGARNFCLPHRERLEQIDEARRFRGPLGEVGLERALSAIESCPSCRSLAGLPVRS